MTSSKVMTEYHFVIVDYLVDLKTGRPEASSDAAALEWVQLDEVEKRDLTMSFRKFFAKNCERLKAETESHYGGET